MCSLGVVVMASRCRVLGSKIKHLWITLWRCFLHTMWNFLCLLQKYACWQITELFLQFQLGDSCWLQVGYTELLKIRLDHNMSGTWGHFGCKNRAIGKVENKAWFVLYGDFWYNKSSISQVQLLAWLTPSSLVYCRLLTSFSVAVFSLTWGLLFWVGKGFFVFSMCFLLKAAQGLHRAAAVNQQSL